MPELPYELTDDLRLKLLALGWSDDRRVDLDHVVKKVQAVGWHLFPVAEAFVSVFDGLGTWAGYIFDLEDAGTNWPFSEFYQFVRPDVSERIFPVGEYNGWSPLFISESGRLLEFVGKDMHWLGDTPQQSFEALIDRMSRECGN
ncbi:SUKH-3 domain-containing protein [Deinococcus multiflagellatus]|uniref:SUKH-3 domain-containing protein n=1 Tax=Deinococcus multiflagellatus TaxID=1656887 RepID=A0ABW1ZG73_9DEIO|nr:SUKH-3 domain-containing protein [Deinococcus multiflagellatus]MBZ9711698.1 SUKH-3 domain-containing protein [Deinococcus multiflagellatus]